MPINNLVFVFSELLRSVLILRKENLILSELVIIYSSIDACSWLNAPADATSNKKAYFLSWVDRYMTPEVSLGCKSIDLYGARCGILHSMNAVSELSKKEEAREIYYAIGKSDSTIQNKLIDFVYETNKPITVSINDLIFGTFGGIAQFLNEKIADQLVIKRGEKFFRYVEGKEFKPLIEFIREIEQAQG